MGDILFGFELVEQLPKRLARIGFDLLRQTPVELLYFAVTAAMLYACVRLQSRALLLTTVLAMLGFIGYFTAEHFVDSLGWPISLILMGVAFIGVGALAMRIKRQM